MRKALVLAFLVFLFEIAFAIKKPDNKKHPAAKKQPKKKPKIEKKEKFFIGVIIGDSQLRFVTGAKDNSGKKLDKIILGNQPDNSDNWTFTKVAGTNFLQICTPHNTCITEDNGIKLRGKAAGDMKQHWICSFHEDDNESFSCTSQSKADHLEISFEEHKPKGPASAAKGSEELVFLAPKGPKSSSVSLSRFVILVKKDVETAFLKSKTVHQPCK